MVAGATRLENGSITVAEAKGILEVLNLARNLGLKGVILVGGFSGCYWALPMKIQIP